MVAADSLLVEFTVFGLLGELWDEREELRPDVVFSEDFCALHLEASVEDGKGDLLVGGKEIEGLDVELVFKKILLFYLFD